MRPALLLAAAALLLGGCGRAREVPSPDEEAPHAATPPASALPEASSIRFEQTKGEGFSKEGWDLEILQLGGDIRVRGGVHAAGSYVPVYRVMSSSEFQDLWQWIKAFPLDGFKVTEDTTAAAEGWRKSFRFDAVLSPEKRELSDNEWTRPPTNAPWLQAIEDRMHLMVVDLAGKEIEEEKKEPPVLADSAGIMQKAMEAIGEAPSPKADSSRIRIR